jgi:hypothetical protein
MSSHRSSLFAGGAEIAHWPENSYRTAQVVPQGSLERIIWFQRNLHWNLNTEKRKAGRLKPARFISLIRRFCIQTKTHSTLRVTAVPVFYESEYGLHEYRRYS